MIFGMFEVNEKHYSVDAGPGEKLDGCPYSIYEDGRDVQDYIIPPKGYVFKKFIFQPLPDNQVYDGKLIAQYEKEPLKERMTTALQVLIWVLIAGSIIGIITVLTIGVFKPKKPTLKEPQRPTETMVVAADTIFDSDTLSTLPLDTLPEANQVVENQEITETSEPVLEPEQPAVADDNQLFQQEFWDLIHQREMAMDSYDGLYKNYKGKVSGEEFDYLRFTVLKDYPSYKDWSAKLRKVPTKEIESIETIDALKNKLKEIK